MQWIRDARLWWQQRKVEQLANEVAREVMNLRTRQMRGLVADFAAAGLLG